MVVAAAVLEDGGYLAFSDAAVKLYEVLTPALRSTARPAVWERLSGGHPWIEVELGDGRATEPPRVRFLTRSCSRPCSRTCGPTSTAVARRFSGGCGTW